MNNCLAASSQESPVEAFVLHWQLVRLRPSGFITYALLVVIPFPSQGPIPLLVFLSSPWSTAYVQILVQGLSPGQPESI